ncbi:glycosyltransferase family 2 protein [Parvibacter caecicola]|uniref:Undecaprenyl-phosphate 4-deoxy-4-formamido-L-arabinose transferase n=1 Tax=Parvibacter caecicola TaxID=747645 RepID=A0A7W5D2H0_9ACTN|nr:glycosyltransferase family 2 protein [Parvibacter caecicola]MBB3171246.1 undecaprenyl-phosphate 4-deoxy-4-formamido-L-arabinose transferase [Parvibacter caecicola]MCR2041964.1 glycosyltransferase family 2 protein [Parvibacter caecicola]RNL09800.1 glycosyltransferase [Parvibacter caecicola]
MLVSVVIPCYYSEDMIEEVVELTKKELVEAGYEYEFILVNDGSVDGTFDAIERLCATDAEVVGVNCAKNSGQHNAIMAGLRETRGDIVMLMDDDMQTHPSQCLKLLSKMKEGYDVVFAEWEQQREAWWRLLGSRFATWSMRALTSRPKDIYSSNFVVFRRHVRDEVVRYCGPYVYIQGLLFRATANMANVKVTHFERTQGSSGYSLKSLIRLWSTVLNFSMVPLRLATVFGASLGIVGLASAVVIFAMRMMDPQMQAGWPSLMATVLTCSGLIILFLGIIGEYLGRVFMTINNAPQYVLKRVVDNRPQVRQPCEGND